MAEREMLENLKSPARKTAIMYGARLSYKQLCACHAVPAETGLITRAPLMPERAAI